MQSAAPTRPVVIANVLALGLFLLSVAVQFNDPDPLPWIAIYGAAAVACSLAATGRLAWELAAGVGLLATAWGATLVGTAWDVPFADLFAAWHMTDAHVEVARECGGLGLVAGWMFLDAAIAYRHERRVGSITARPADTLRPAIEERAQPEKIREVA